MAVVRLLLLAVALLRLVVVPCLNAHKRPVRDPLYSFNSLLIRHARDLPKQDRIDFVASGMCDRLERDS